MSFLKPQQHGLPAERRPLLQGRRRYVGKRPEQSDEDSNPDDDEDGLPVTSRHLDPESQHQLPIFSSARLDRIPAYHLQHSIRLLVVRKVDTTLSWDQLRTPQISQFLVKPIQQEIRSKHLTSATLYALLANALQFQKDGQLDPGTIGLSGTRAFICELLAMRLLKDYSTRELIDALFYDFDPLQGLSARTGGNSYGHAKSKAQTRLSTVEIAIRAYAKRFLAHPLVVQQLEAVWAGSIVFHSVADTLHRSKPGFLPSASMQHQGPSYGALTSPRPQSGGSYGQDASKGKARRGPEASMRRTVTIYDPAEASIFKLSRLRVPRYRQLFSTLSYAIMLSLFLAVLIERSTDITALELVFWFWGAGYMLDELVGFSEQGFELYIISVWNAFDIGILLFFIAYYVLRLYGILIPWDGRSKRHVANMAYDVLGTTAVLLFPRLFSVLDHYRYFSQLLIAFRMMAVDLSAILILIVISCSGFFIAFTFSFADTSNDTRETAYTIFKIVMGFTPAAWDIWDDYNFLGKAILSVFLVICHFLIVTILITVLTNSFMAVVQNSNAEHQFLFAVNTISMVKSDALFSYVAPTNIFGWTLSPIRFIIPFKQFVSLNRTVIKITHLPMLLIIFLYERLILASRDQSRDLLNQQGRERPKVPAFSIRGAEDVFSPGPRLREPSLATHQKDRALERVFENTTLFVQDSREIAQRRPSIMRNKSSNVIHHWMHGVGREGGAASPIEQSRSIVDRLETRKPTLHRHRTAPVHHYFEGARSAVSDPEDIHQPFEGFGYIREDAEDLDMSMEDIPQQTDADGDDEMATVEDDDFDAATHDDSNRGVQKQRPTSDKENSSSSKHRASSQKLVRRPLQEIRNPTIGSELSSASPRTPASQRNSQAVRSEEGVYGPLASITPEQPSTQQRIAPKRDRAHHFRTSSSATILFAPLDVKAAAAKRKSAVAASPVNIQGSQPSSHAGLSNSGKRALQLVATQATTSKNTSPRRKHSRDEESDTFGPLLSRRSRQSATNLASLLTRDRRKPSFTARALDLASDIGDNRAVPQVEFLSASYGTQLEMAAMRRRRRRSSNRNFGGRRIFSTSDDDDDDDDANDNDNDEDEDDNDDDDDDHNDNDRPRNGGGDTRRLNRLMLARMSTLEEGFRDILREVKGLSQAHSRASRSVVDENEAPAASLSAAAASAASAAAPAGGSGVGGKATTSNNNNNKVIGEAKG